MHTTPLNLKTIHPYGIVIPHQDDEVIKQVQLKVDAGHKNVSDIQGFEGMEVINECVKGGGVCVDIGAFWGDTAGALWRMGAKTVHAFEAFYDAYCCLCINCPQPNIIKYHAAMGDGRSVKLDGAGIYPGMRYVEDGGMIPTMKLDSLGLDKVDFLKIDVEGFEIAVFHGCIDTIRRCRPLIMCEVFPSQMIRYGFTVELLNQILDKDLDYTFAPHQTVYDVGWDYICRPK